MSTLAKAVVFCGIVLGIGLACGGRALALTEYCPARVGGFQALGAAPSALYSLTAESARSVQGVLLVETTTGWYEVQFPSTAIAQRGYQYSGAFGNLSRTGYESDPLYVRFPSPTKVDAVYVAHAQTHGETDFGWDAKGDYARFPEPQRVPTVDIAMFGMTTVRSPRTALAAPPEPQAPIALASPAAPPGSPSCDQPNTYAVVAKPMSPDFPMDERTRRTPAMSIIAVVIDAAGQLTDSWVYLSSGSPSFDAVAMQAARESTYRPGRMLCQPVGGEYFFRAEFRPKGARQPGRCRMSHDHAVDN